MSNPRVLVLAGDYVEDYEVAVPHHAFDMLGYRVAIAAPGRAVGDTIETAVHLDGGPTYAERPGHPITLTATFAELEPGAVDALLLPGGRAPEYIRNRPGVIAFVQAIASEGKPIGAMCHGIQVLTAADLVEGRQCTGFPELEPDVVQAGGEWRDERVVVDGQLITAQGYEDLGEWLAAIRAALDSQQPLADEPTAAE